MLVVAVKLANTAIVFAMARLPSRKSGDGEAELRRDVGEDEKAEAAEDQEQEEVEEDEEDAEAEEGNGEDQDQDQDEAITEYEKQRLKTIERNKAMLASLQLPGLASSLTQSSRAKSLESISKSKGGGGPRRRSERLKSVTGKRSSVAENESSSSDKSDSETESLSPSKRKRKDQEYEPTDDEGSLSESEDEADEHEEEVLQEDGFVVPANVDIDEEEYALQQALALSLGASVEATDSLASSKKTKKRSPAKKKKVAKSADIDPLDELEDSPKLKPSKGKSKRKTQKMSNKRHFTEGEVDALFPFFDERGRGLLTLNGLERVSTTHDFTWSAEELLDMIHLFSRNHNGALDLVDFRNVTTRCNLIISER